MGIQLPFSRIETLLYVFVVLSFNKQSPDDTWPYPALDGEGPSFCSS